MPPYAALKLQLPVWQNCSMHPAASVDVLLHVLLTLSAIIILGRILGALLKPLGQPQVIGDILAGILLGPSLIGAQASAWLLPAAAAPSLGLIAQLGVILYMFLVGLETNAGILRGQLRQTAFIASAGMALPFALGLALAMFLHARVADAQVPLSHFALFIGVALSVTAFPVLARILADRNLQKTPLGLLALGSAAAGDAVAWCGLALVVGVVQSGSGGTPVAIGTLVYVVVMLALVRPLAVRWVNRLTPAAAGNGALVTAIVACVLSAAATQWIGIHALFGAFLMGLLIPHDSALAQTLDRRLNDVVSIVFLPAFFAYAGLRTQINLVQGLEQWLLVILIILVATLGKFGGVAAAARLAGHDWRAAAALGALMNTRGLMELIVLNIGLDLHVISPTLYSMLVLMALVTTMATAPLLRLLGVRALP
jgi:Kef-type K+ transport system membrane component KefB